METSYFSQYIDKYYKAIVEKITELINGKKEEDQLYYKKMLTPEYSVNLRWGSKDVNGSVVAADVVSLGSSLPLKKRDTISVATGKIPKLGIKLKKDEEAIQEIQMMRATGANDAIIAQKIFDDIPKVIKGIELRKEYMFLQGLSTGVTLVESDKNDGTGIRVSFGYKDENTMASYLPWGSEGYTPVDDLQKVFDRIDENSHSVATTMMSKKYFNLLKNSDQGKELSAGFRGMVYTTVDSLPTPSTAGFISALEDKFGCKFEIVDSTIRIEKNGVQVSYKPWEQANIVFLYDDLVGRLVYGSCPEEAAPSKNVNYQKGEQNTLISKYSTPDPLEEVTSAQALALPVIDGVHSIYLLKADQTAITADPTSLSFTKSANTTGKTITVSTLASTITAVSDSDWATVTVADKVATVKVGANAGAERTAVISIADSNGNEITIDAVQAAVS